MPKPKPIKYIKELKQFYINKSKMYGGNDEDTFDGDDFDSIMKYILHKLNKKIIAKQTSNTTKVKHLIMLYGPPASGKSIAKQIMLSKFSIDDDDYIDINLDDIIGNDRKYKSELEALKKEHEALKKEHGNISPSVVIQNRATNLYFSIRNKANLVFELLVFITRLYDISLVVEVTGGTYCSMIWWYNILRFFKTKKYTISLIYPVVTDAQQIVSRANERGKEIFRFVSVDVINENIKGAKMNIKTIIDDSRAMFHNFDNIYIYKNEDSNFVPYAKMEDKGKLLKLFDDNIIYKKENGRNLPLSEDEFMKVIISESSIFYEKGSSKSLKPKSCKLTY
jgi:hypothetical protein